MSMQKVKRGKKCRECSKEFYPKPIHYLQSKYCSMSCYGKARRKTVVRTCTNCSKEYEFQPSQLNHYKNAGKYCSRDCAYSKRVTDAAKRPIKDKYGRSRRKADIDWQRAVRERDGRICRRCGKYEEYIHTHHVALRSQRPDLKHDVDNGICLCASCHSWVHLNPKEAKAQGFISDERYGVAEKAKRNANISKALDKGLRTEVCCTQCGKTKVYPNSSLGHISSEHYRCLDCYTSTHVKRTGVS